MSICKRCGSDISDLEEKCPTCGWNAGPPNVRAAKREEEREALENRYAEAIEDAKQGGSYQSLASFDENMKKTCAVMNIDIDWLKQFVTSDKPLYTTYSLAVKGQIRRAAGEKEDRRRRAVEALLFGAYREELRYAALSLDGGGLKSYGPYAIKLREIAINERATLLEDNSYRFVDKHALRPDGEIPPGYRTTWEERHKLAVSKLAGRILPGTSEKEHSKILLSGKGDRATDDYIEVHIYGSFDNKAIESVKGSSSAKKKDDRALVSSIKDRLKKAGIVWVEE